MFARLCAILLAFCLAFAPSHVGDCGPVTSNGPLVVGGSPATRAPRAAGFTLDFTAAALTYPHLTASRTGTAPTVWLQRSATTVVASTGGSDALYEVRDGLLGIWSFGSYTNAAPAAFDMRVAAGWTFNGTLLVTATDGTATYVDPAGANTAQRFKGAVSGTGPNNFFSLTFGNFYQSVWVRDWPGDVATSPGGSIGKFASVPNLVWSGTSLSYSRQEAWMQSQYVGYWPAGASSAGALTPGATGSEAIWGALAVAGSHAVPLVDGTKTATAVLQTDATAAGKLVNALGDLDIEVDFSTSVDDWLHETSFYLWSSDATAAHSLRWDASTESLILSIAGSDVLTTGSPTTGHPNTSMFSDRTMVHKVRAWYRPSHLDGGIRVTVGGATSVDASVTPGSATPLTAATSLYLGSLRGATSHFARYSRVMLARTIAAIAPEFIVVGDSTSAAFDPAASRGFLPSAASSIYTVAEAATHPGIALLAHPGDTIAGQKTAWLASGVRHASSVKAVSILCGINDILGGASSATVLASLADLVATVRADQPTAKIALFAPMPARGALSAPQYAVWQAVVAGLTGVAGADRYDSSLIGAGAYTIDDGSGNIAAQYDCGDHLHENALARRAQVGPAYRAAFVAMGQLTIGQGELPEWPVPVGLALVGLAIVRGRRAANDNDEAEEEDEKKAA